MDEVVVVVGVIGTISILGLLLIITLGNDTNHSFCTSEGYDGAIGNYCYKAGNTTYEYREKFTCPTFSVEDCKLIKYVEAP